MIKQENLLKIMKFKDFVSLQKYSIKYERKLFISRKLHVRFQNIICDNSSQEENGSGKTRMEKTLALAILWFSYSVLFSRTTTLSPGRQKH